MENWTKEQEIALINQTQDEYVNELIQKLKEPTKDDKAMKCINFTSPTGTGKTKMMAKLINSLPNYYFLVTTLSRGGLHYQVAASLRKDCKHNNWTAYGVSSYTKTSLLQDEDILRHIECLPVKTKIVWIRDEGHINSNNWMRLLEDKCDKIVNFSATNKIDYGILCKFSHTLMLRTVTQAPGTIEDALDKLTEVKKAHIPVHEYNPCALFRVVSNEVEQLIITACKKRRLKCVSLVDAQPCSTAELCEDNNPYDVIINKMKIVEGIDIRRAHVLWMENQPTNIDTTIQAIGRLRRNALLWRKDIDILSPKHQTLLEQTRQCYVFYNVQNMRIDADENGELCREFCPRISVQDLKPNTTIHVRKGQMANGLWVTELTGRSGKFRILMDEETGFLYVDNPEFYKNETICSYTLRYDNGIAVSVNEEITKLEALNAWMCTQDDKYFDSLSKEYTQYIRNGELLNVTYFGLEEKIYAQYRQPIISAKGAFLTETEEIGDINTHALGQLLTKHTRCHEHAPMPSVTMCYGTHRVIVFFDEYQYIIQHHTLPPHALNAKRFIKTHNAWCKYISPYTPQLLNNRLLSILAIHHHKPVKAENGVQWVPVNTVREHIQKKSKLQQWLHQQFEPEFQIARSQLFSGHNAFNLPKKLNACLGTCVEYYAKYVAYGASRFDRYMQQAQKEYNKLNALAPNTPSMNDYIIVRACILKAHADEVAINPSARTIGVSMKALLEANADEFVRLVIQYGQRAAAFLQTHLNIAQAANMNHVFATKHLTGVADALDAHTIIDIKCHNNITEDMCEQVLAYYYLSTFDTQYNIQQVIVYDAVADKACIIPIHSHMHHAYLDELAAHCAACETTVTDKPYTSPPSLDEELYNNIRKTCIKAAMENYETRLAQYTIQDLLNIWSPRKPGKEYLLGRHNDSCFELYADAINETHMPGLYPYSAHSKLYYYLAYLAHKEDALIIFTEHPTEAQMPILREIYKHIHHTRENDQQVVADLKEHIDEYRDALMSAQKTTQERFDSWCFLHATILIYSPNNTQSDIWI